MFDLKLDSNEYNLSHSIGRRGVRKHGHLKGIQLIKSRLLDMSKVTNVYEV